MPATREQRLRYWRTVRTQIDPGWEERCQRALALTAAGAGQRTVMRACGMTQYMVRSLLAQQQGVRLRQNRSVPRSSRLPEMSWREINRRLSATVTRLESGERRNVMAEEELKGALFTDEKSDREHRYGIAFSPAAYRRFNALEIEAEINRLTARLKAAVYRDWLEARTQQQEPSPLTLAPAAPEVPTERAWNWDQTEEATPGKSW